MEDYIYLYEEKKRKPVDGLVVLIILDSLVREKNGLLYVRRVKDLNDYV